MGRMKRMRSWTGLVALAFSLGLPGNVSAQAVASEISGRVESRGGVPLPRSIVVLEGQQEQREATTDAEGYYRFSPLTVGEYRLVVRAKGYVGEAREGLKLLAGERLEVNFGLHEIQLTIRAAAERGARQRNPNIFIRRVDFNALRDRFLRRGFDAELVELSAVENNYAADLGAPVRRILFVRPEGPRRFHASLYETHQNSAANARPFFNVGPLRSSKQNQFGLSVGGALLPEQLFFTANADFVRASGFVNGNVRVPLPEERTPTATDPQTREIVAALLRAFPQEDPNLPGVSMRQLNTNAIRRIQSEDLDLRFDYLPGSQDSVAFRYTIFDYSEEPFEPVVGRNPKTELRPQTFGITHRREWSVRTIHDASFQFDRVGAVLTTTEAFQQLLAPLGLENVPDIDFGGRLADLTNIGPGNQFPRRRFQNQFSGQVNFSHQQGRHLLRFGGRSTRAQVNDLQSDNSRGTFKFTASEELNPEGETVVLSAVDNFLRGTPTSFTITQGDLYRGFRNWEHALYLQDSFQLRPGLTWTFGVRYEVVTAPTEINGLTEIAYRADRNNVAPQMGFAWAPGGGSTVVRAGYGISFGHVFPGTYQSARFNPPAVSTISVQAPSLTDPLAGSGMVGTELRSELNLLSPDLVSPYSHQYNLTIQRSLPANLLFEIGYVGSRTFKPFSWLHTNRAEPFAEGATCMNPDPDGLCRESLGNIDERRPDPRFLRIQTILNRGVFYYDAMKLRLTRSLTSGLAFDASYIFSKALTTTANDPVATLNFEAGPSRSQTAENQFNDLKAHTNFDHTHILIFNYSYDLPFRSGGSRWLRTLLEGWQISGTTELRTGRWYGVETSSDRPGFGNVDGEGGDRPNVLRPGLTGRTIDHPDISLTISNPDFFDSNLPVGRGGTAPLRLFRADPINNTNLAMTKSFAIAGNERMLQFRAEFQNLFNHALFVRPGDVFPADIFGKIVDTQNRGRVIRFTLRLNF